jgi:hypothetical protein
MQLLDRYLAAVARNLPKAQAADITAELRDNLLSEIEEKEAGLGRKLNDKELEQLLIDFGHPLSVAARYGKARHLIGPEIYPFWLATLRVVGGVAAALVVGALIVTAISTHQSVDWVVQRALEQFWSTALTVFGGVTLVFAFMERGPGGRMKLKWSPRTLPPPRSPGRKPSELIGEMVMDGLFLLWWTGVLQFRNFVPIPSFVHVQLAPVWAEFHWLILAYAVTELVINAVELARPVWVRLNAVLSLAKNLWGCAMFYEILQVGHWIQVDAPTVTAFALNQMRHGFDRGMQLGILGTLIVLACKAAWDVWRLVRGRANGGHANGGAASPAGAALA